MNTVVVSGDSRQFYKEMSIGTAKPSPEEMQGVPHYFINSHSIHDELSAADFAKQASEKINELNQELIILTGGSGMFLDALCNGLDDIPHDDEIRNELSIQLEELGLESLLDELAQKDPRYFEEVDRSNPMRIIRALTAIRLSGKPISEMRSGEERPQYHVRRYIIDLSRELMYSRINLRVDDMMNQGLEKEALPLIQLNNKLVNNTVGYKEFIPYYQKECELKDVIEAIKMNSRRYSKRQMTWFRRYDDAIWIPFSDTNTMKNKILEDFCQNWKGLE